MSHKVVYYLPFPKGTVTRHVTYALSLRRARTIAVREYRKHRKHGPVSILNDVGEVVATDGMVRLLAEGDGPTLGGKWLDQGVQLTPPNRKLTKGE